MKRFTQMQLCLWSLILSVSLFAQSSRHAALQAEFASIAGSIHGKVGIAAELIETGETVQFAGDQQYPMQSVYKLPIAMAVFQAVEQGKLKLGQKIEVLPSDYVLGNQHSPIRDQYPQGTKLSLQEIIHYAVSESDGSACDVLLRLLGGAPVVDAYLQNLNINGIKVLNTEKEIGSDSAVQYRNWAQPLAAVQLLKILQTGKSLTSSHRKLLLRFMTQTETGRNRIKGLLPKSVLVAHKTGTAWTRDGMTAATNDIGIITLPNGKHLAVAVLVMDSNAGQAEREGVIAKAARAAYDYWSK